MIQKFIQDISDLPYEPRSLGLELNFPLSCLSSIQDGYEAQDQNGKWSIYYRSPWIQIWRPTAKGLYCYAVRFEQTGNQCIRTAESWVGSQILDASLGFGSDLEQHRQMVTELLDISAKFSGERFEHGSLTGVRGRKKSFFQETRPVLKMLTRLQASYALRSSR